VQTEFDFMGQILDARKVAAGSVRDSIKVKLDAGDAERASQAAGVSNTTRGFTLPPGQYRMQVSGA